LASRCIDVLSDNPSGPKLRLLHEKLEEVVETFQYIATRVEDNWIRSEGILDAGESLYSPNVKKNHGLTMGIRSSNKL